jgi:hypothetical protein
MEYIVHLKSVKAYLLWTQLRSLTVTNIQEVTLMLLLKILPVVLYGCETWSLILREEHRLRVFENRVVRRIFGPKRDEVTGGWRKLHSEELHNIF